MSVRKKIGGYMVTVESNYGYAPNMRLLEKIDQIYSQENQLDGFLNDLECSDLSEVLANIGSYQEQIEDLTFELEGMKDYIKYLEEKS